ncbi:MAG: hypothetical protein WA919_20065 [Coleofasciculaceae cyanobacterium]
MSPQFNQWVGRPWAIVRISNETRPTTLVRFVNRQDAEDYLELIKYLLKPQGELIGIFLIKNPTSEPPWASTPNEIGYYFQPYFDLLWFEYVSDSEYLGHFRLR